LSIILERIINQIKKKIPIMLFQWKIIQKIYIFNTVHTLVGVLVQPVSRFKAVSITRREMGACEKFTRLSREFVQKHEILIDFEKLFKHHDFSNVATLKTGTVIFKPCFESLK